MLVSDLADQMITEMMRMEQYNQQIGYEWFLCIALVSMNSVAEKLILIVEQI